MENQFKRIMRLPSHRQLKRADFRGKKVLVRFDLNVPIEGGKILDDSRILAALPTLKKIIERGAKQVNIICHLGRPIGLDKNFSTIYIADELSKLFRSKNKAKKIETDEKSPALKHYYQITDKINLFENLRFDSREEKNSTEFAKELAGLGDVFVQDAFANIHRAHTSMVKLQECLPTFAGLLLEKEINVLFRLLSIAEKPFVVIIGGVKIEDKIPIIESLSQKADAVLVGGVTGNEWVAQNLPTKENIFLPNDGVNKFGAIVPVTKETVKNGVFDIGPQTILLFKGILSSAKTVFWNGNLGMTENKRFIHGTNEIARFVAKIKAEKVASGGNTADVIDDLGLREAFNFISTGGGATSDLICGKKLPALEMLLK